MNSEATLCSYSSKEVAAAADCSTAPFVVPSAVVVVACTNRVDVVAVLLNMVVCVSMVVSMCVRMEDVEVEIEVLAKVMSVPASAVEESVSGSLTVVVSVGAGVDAVEVDVAGKVVPVVTSVVDEAVAGCVAVVVSLCLGAGVDAVEVEAVDMLVAEVAKDVLEVQLSLLVSVVVETVLVMSVVVDVMSISEAVVVVGSGSLTLFPTVVLTVGNKSKLPGPPKPSPTSSDCKRRKALLGKTSLTVLRSSASPDSSAWLLDP